MTSARATAFWACWASSMVSSFFAFSAVRSSVASAMAASNSAISSVSLATSEANLAMEVSSWSFSAWRVSTCAVFSFRVCSLVDNSESHQLLCSASSEASSISRVMRSLIICLTLPNGSASTRVASMDSTRLPVLPAWRRKKSATRFWACGACTLERKAARECPPPRVCASVGRCFSAYPLTVSPRMISMAFSMATISSARSCCFSSKDSDFSAHSTLVSANSFSSDTLTSARETACLVSSAALPCLSDMRADLVPMLSFAFSIEAVRSWRTMSKACCAFISSFSTSPFFETNSSKSLFSISTMPPDWNSYAFASGAS
mmetsp:Transcript_69341/g.184093  ORF Transcript_69341/g.184093 Transcript_69341/m.184093 type:complete len:318 (-) Transcript_69341:698-1651(-)